MIRRYLPAKLLTSLVGILGASKNSLIKGLFIGLFARFYRVNMQEAERESLGSYENFNDFFTRTLKPDARPIADSQLICPADGAISQIGNISNNQLLQAKGKTFSLEALLADEAMAKQFYDGQFATIYLSPKDYHRVHMPFSGKLIKTIYVPGALFSVDDQAARTIDNLFARNERVVCFFETEYGTAVVIMVAALVVGGIHLVWQGRIKRQRTLQTIDYSDQTITLEKGDTMGAFFAGSTAIVILPKGAPALDEKLIASAPVRMGQAFSD